MNSFQDIIRLGVGSAATVNFELKFWLTEL